MLFFFKGWVYHKIVTKENQLTYKYHLSLETRLKF